MESGEARVVDRAGLDLVVAAVSRRGWRVMGPVVRGGAVVPGEVASSADLPAGYHDHQEPGGYRLTRGEDPALFGWAVGPGSWKSEFFPPRERVWRARREIVDGAAWVEEVDEGPSEPVALFGARPCEVAGLAVLDKVLGGERGTDPRYTARREASFVVVAECTSPAATCFCTSMGGGPEAAGEFDLALTELLDDDGHRFVIRAGSAVGAEVLEEVGGRPATDADEAARRRDLAGAEAAITRAVDAGGVAQLLARNLEHPRWDQVAERCLSCGNCTLVCPTCFCSDVDDVTDLEGTVERHRQWSSCFDLEHSFLHGGAVRPSVRSRYRQWMTHKLSSWWDQFGTSGCVGCGRCVTWCPVGIDITEEVAAIAATDGARGVSAGAAGPGSATR